ncbi:MAG: metal-sensitive transcriptional regulator [Syntrophomonadaceae bacterium]|nr:metal-sensitive transcriptional regulator [Syntrophomonadaceae bacterium]MDH7498036.1 metal-sensitive transcriptional regulator [Syntrophomonadaceae bacterium]
MERSEGSREILHRLRRIEGQVRGVQRMLEQESSCVDVLNQIAAVKAAVNQVGVLVYAHYVRDCVAHAVADGDCERAVKEIAGILGRIVR